MCIFSAHALARPGDVRLISPLRAQGRNQHILLFNVVISIIDPSKESHQEHLHNFILLFEILGYILIVADGVLVEKTKICNTKGLYIIFNQHF